MRMDCSCHLCCLPAPYAVTVEPSECRKNFKADPSCCDCLRSGIDQQQLAGEAGQSATCGLGVQGNPGLEALVVLCTRRSAMPPAPGQLVRPGQLAHLHGS